MAVETEPAFPAIELEEAEAPSLGFWNWWAALALEVGRGRVVAETALASEGPLAGAALDPAEPLDVDVDELARSRALVTERLLEPEPTESAQAASRQDPGDGRDRRDEQGSRRKHTSRSGRSCRDPSAKRRNAEC